jgi:hypothetical protein
VQDLVLDFKFDGWATEEAGAPPELHMVFRSWTYTDSIMMDIMYDEKVATRFSEALWIRFQPSRDHAELRRMNLSKINTFISPHEVVRIIPVSKTKHFVGLNISGSVPASQAACYWGLHLH